MNPSPKIFVDTSEDRENVSDAIKMSSGSMRIVELSVILLRSFLFFILERVGVKTAFNEGAKITPKRMMLFAAP